MILLNNNSERIKVELFRPVMTLETNDTHTDDSEHCAVTTQHMLEVCGGGYRKILRKLENRLNALTDKYYDLPDVPKDVIDEISDLNEQIDKHLNTISDIDRAIDVIGGVGKGTLL